MEEGGRHEEECGKDGREKCPGTDHGGKVKEGGGRRKRTWGLEWRKAGRGKEE
jgi:hypothetical protein